MNHTITTSLANFKACVEDAPEGTYVEAKNLNEVIGDTCDQLIRNLRVIGLKANNCDLIYNLEATIYDYVKRSNPDHAMFAVSEGFGSSMNSLARKRVIEHAERSRDFLLKNIITN